jgi:UDP-GlcNAc:undecaprenyl-phosphate GlcNAc-1-phosphate transferase
VTPITIVLAVCTLSLILSAAVVPVLRQLARGGGLYEQPVVDRWHRRPVPKLGGVAMAVAFAAVAWAFADTPALRALVVAAAAMGVLGLIDDFWPLRPLVKMMGQVAVAALFLWFAPSINLTGEPVVDEILAFIWFVGITNAFNLLDNIDGAAAGIAAIAGVFFVVALTLNGASDLAALAIVVAAMTGVALGFLVHNWHPASIFMGDSGSHLLGSFFAGATILAAPHMHANSEVGVAIGVVLLFVPCADTTLVILTRQLAGRSAFVGGRDHLSHRIVALGLDERRAVLTLYALAVAGGLVALGLQNLDPAVGWIPAVLYGAGVAAMGFYLGHIDIDREVDSRLRRLPLPTELASRYRGYEVLLDLALVALAYYIGVLLRFHGEPDLDRFLAGTARVLPLVILLHAAGLWLSGKYRRRTSTSVAALMTIVRGVAIGSAASVVAILYITRFEGYSRQAIAIAAGLSVLFLAGGRLLLHAIDEHLRRRPANGPMALIYGAGRRGALAARELADNPAWRLTPLGFIDDDPARRGERVEGARVLGTLDDLEAIVAREAGRITTLIVAMSTFPAHRLDELRDVCDHHGVEVQQFRASFEDIETEKRDRPARIAQFPRA